MLGKLDPQPAAARAIGVLQRTSATFFKQGGCGSCHAQNLISMAVNTAYANHIPVDMEAKSAEIEGAQLMLGSFQQPLLQRGDPPVVDILLYAGMQLASENTVPDATTDALVHNLAAQQKATGNWHVGGLGRPPMEDGDFSRTALGIRLLQAYGPAGRKAEFQKRIERAAHWLAANPPKTTEDANMQLLGLKWAGVTRRRYGRRRAPPARDAARRRRMGPDSRPSQRRLCHGPGALHAPRTRRSGQVPGVPPRRSVSAADTGGGRHLVCAEPGGQIQPYFETAFPYGPDQWISMSATSWAAMAISYASGPQQVARR